MVLSSSFCVDKRNPLMFSSKVSSNNKYNFFFKETYMTQLLLRKRNGTNSENSCYIIILTFYVFKTADETLRKL